MIYFIQGEITKRIKIGYTKGFIQKRMQDLQTGSPDKLIFLGAHPGTEKEESELHTMFHQHRLHGEWFNNDESLNEYISNQCFHSMEAAYSVDSLEQNSIIDRDESLLLNEGEISNKYNALIVSKLG